MPSPDVFVIERQVWRRFREQNMYPKENLILAVEVISPSNTETHVDDKTALYLRNGAVQVWTVYPFDRRFELHESGACHKHERGDVIVLPRPLPNVSIDSAEFFYLN